MKILVIKKGNKIQAVYIGEDVRRKRTSVKSGRRHRRSPYKFFNPMRKSVQIRLLPWRED